MEASIYFPILYAKAGEIGAIGYLAPATHDATRPTFDFPCQKPGDTHSLEQYLGKKIDEIKRSWGTRDEVYLDFSRYEPDAATDDGGHIVDYVFEIARQSHLKAIPVVAPVTLRGPGTLYFDAVSRVALRDGRGVAYACHFRILRLSATYHVFLARR